jgi:hypothetical protein
LNEGGVVAEPLPVAPPWPVTPATIAGSARVSRSGKPAASYRRKSPFLIELVMA